MAVTIGYFKNCHFRWLSDLFKKLTLQMAVRFGYFQKLTLQMAARFGHFFSQKLG